MKTIRLLLLAIAMMAGFALPARAANVCYQPGPSEGMDTWYGNVYNKNGMPNDPSLRMGGWGDRYDGGLRFNLSGMPHTATAASFYLFVIPGGGTPTPTQWWWPSANWQEATASLANPVTQGTYLGLASAPPPMSTWHQFTITSIYNLWRTGNTGSLNYGFKILPTMNNNNFSAYASSDYGNPSLRPIICVDSPSTETRIVLKWPLGTAYANRVVNLYFDKTWPVDSFCPAGVRKQCVCRYNTVRGNWCTATD